MLIQKSLLQRAMMRIAVIATTLFALSASAQAVTIQTVTSPAGIVALLVEDYTVPLIALQFSFDGGASQDDNGKEGTSDLLTALLDEGAADIKSQAFQQKLDDVGMSYGFNTGRDTFSGYMKTLQSNSDQSFELMALMLNSPRFDDEPIGRMKASLLSRLKRMETSPQAIAGKAMRESVFAGHTYSRPTKGTIESLTKVTREDIIAYHQHVMARDTLVIGVVGAISAEELKLVLDKIFARLPATAKLKSIPEAKIISGKTIHKELPVPQTNIAFSMPGIKRDDPDFYAGYLVNYVLGGGSFSSRLYEEVREKRGLAYGVYSYLGTFDHAGMVGAGSATGTENAAKTVAIIRKEMQRMGKEGPTADELEKAKKYITGSYAINNLDTSDKIASTLVAIQRSNLGVDYIDKRAEYISAVTLEHAKRVANKLFSSTPTLITVGKPLTK